MFHYIPVELSTVVLPFYFFTKTMGLPNSKVLGRMLLSNCLKSTSSFAKAGNLRGLR